MYFTIIEFIFHAHLVDRLTYFPMEPQVKLIKIKLIDLVI